jgi:diacylglycerol kinase (ATP)
VRVRLVINPLSGRAQRSGGAVAQRLERLGVEIVEPNASPFDAIVVAGGDGTIARQIPAALGLDVPIGIVPLGTFNDLARTLRIPLDVEGACAAIAAGELRCIDVAHVNGSYYATEASIGISSRVARLQRPESKQRFGLLAIVATALQAVRYARPFRAEIRHDGKRNKCRAIQLTVANSQRFGGFITAGGVAIDDGRLDCYCVQINSLGELFSVARAIVSGRGRSAPGLRAFRSHAFDVSTRRPHRITADGEPAGTTPARFEVLPKALKVLAPPKTLPAQLRIYG